MTSSLQCVSQVCSASGRLTLCCAHSARRSRLTLNAVPTPSSCMSDERYSSSCCFSERLIERHLALHAHLIGRDAALEKVGQLLHVLQLHERERIANVV